MHIMKCLDIRISARKKIFSRKFLNGILNVFWMHFLIQQIPDMKHNVSSQRKMRQGKNFIFFLKLYDVGIVGNKHIIYGVFLNVTEPKQLEWELEKYRLLLSGKRKSGEREQTKEQSEE